MAGPEEQVEALPVIRHRTVPREPVPIGSFGSETDPVPVRLVESQDVVVSGPEDVEGSVVAEALIPDKDVPGGSTEAEPVASSAAIPALAFANAEFPTTWVRSAKPTTAMPLSAFVTWQSRMVTSS